MGILGKQNLVLLVEVTYHIIDETIDLPNDCPNERTIGLGENLTMPRLLWSTKTFQKVWPLRGSVGMDQVMEDIKTAQSQFSLLKKLRKKKQYLYKCVLLSNLMTNCIYPI